MMDASKFSSSVLIERATGSVAQLLRRFENLIALAPVESHDRNSTAVVAYQMKVETAALVRIPFPRLVAVHSPSYLLKVRAAEDIHSLTRSLKEAWMFGQLDTIGDEEATRRMEESARAVVEGLGKSTNERDVARETADEMDQSLS